MARYLVGSGIEVGPGQHPFELALPGTTVSYVDRWHAGESGALFPEHATRTGFTEPDVIADFNTDRLAPIADASQDFVVASHVLEHLAEPIGFLAEIHRVLRPGGVALVLLPDRHRTKDHSRGATSLSHLVAEHEAGVEEVSDDHLAEWLASRGIAATGGSSHQELLDLHRRRSIHVHCWDAPEFLDVVLWSIDPLGQQWEFVDGVLPMDEFPPGIEFGFVLRRSVVMVDAATARRRFEVAWHDWHDAKDAPKLAPIEQKVVRAHRRARRAVWPAVLTYRRARQALPHRGQGQRRGPG
jgi:SAM-dependent methyltransferase